MTVASEELCEKALQQNENRLSRLPNVVGLGIVSRHADEPGAEELAIGVYVRRKVPANRLRRADRIPTRLRVDTGASYRLVPVRVIEQGDVVVEPGGRTRPALGKEPL